MSLAPLKRNLNTSGNIKVQKFLFGGAGMFLDSPKGKDYKSFYMNVQIKCVDFIWTRTNEFPTKLESLDK